MNRNDPRILAGAIAAVTLGAITLFTMFANRKSLADWRTEFVSEFTSRRAELRGNAVVGEMMDNDAVAVAADPDQTPSDLYPENMT